jgi:hypothetical protein
MEKKYLATWRQPNPCCGSLDSAFCHRIVFLVCAGVFVLLWLARGEDAKAVARRDPCGGLSTMAMGAPAAPLSNSVRRRRNPDGNSRCRLIPVTTELPSGFCAAAVVFSLIHAGVMPVYAVIARKNFPPGIMGKAPRNTSRKPLRKRFSVLLALFGWFAALPLSCAAGLLGNMPLPDVPDALRVPQGEEPLLLAKAQGVQIYECRAKKDDPTQYEWIFTGPEADLFDSTGNKVGRHYSGPTWEWNDGSRVVGSVRASVPSSELGAVPWLLLAAKDHAGSGMLSRVTSIQRLETSGGKAPPKGCSEADLGKQLRVPYTAVYCFYVPRA